MKINLLINLPPGFFTHAAMTPIFDSLRDIAEIRTSSHNTPEEIAPDMKWADAVLMWSWPVLTPELLGNPHRLRFSGNLDISQPGARYLFERGIPVSLARKGWSPAVSEMALTLILASLRRTSNYHAQMWQGSEPWVNKFPDDINPDERQLTGRRVGIVGFGQIGQRLAQLLAPFQVQLKVSDPFLPAAVSEKYQAPNVDLDELCRHSEILVLSASANAGTNKLIQARHIAALAPKSILINVCRAAVVDNEALLARLRRGDLFAALDVFDKEPLAADAPWRQLPNVYLTPHRAGGLIESLERIFGYLTTDLRACLAGRPLQHALTEAMISTLDG